MTDQPKQTELWCAAAITHDGKPYYRHFFPNPAAMQICGVDSKDVYRCRVTEDTEQPDSYWAWWDNERKRFTSIIFHKKLLAEICFPYGYKAEEARGRGVLLPVKVEIINEFSSNRNR